MTDQEALGLGYRSTDNCFFLIEDLLIWKAYMSAFKKQNILGSAQSDVFQHQMYRSYIKYLHRENRNDAYLEIGVKNPFQPRTREYINNKLNDEIIPEVMKFVSLFETTSKKGESSEEQCYLDSLEAFKLMYGKPFVFNVRHCCFEGEKTQQLKKISTQSVSTASNTSCLTEEIHGTCFAFPI